MSANVREVATDDYQQSLRVLGMVYQLLKPYEQTWRKLVEADNNADTILPILRPELWMSMRTGPGRKNYEAGVTLAKAALALVQTVDEVLPTLPPGEGGDAILG